MRPQLAASGILLTFSPQICPPGPYMMIIKFLPFGAFTVLQSSKFEYLLPIEFCTKIVPLCEQLRFVLMLWNLSLESLT